MSAWWTEQVKALILGGDGYLGWPTALRFSRAGHDVTVVDNFLRRRLHEERGTDSLVPLASLADRVRAWEELSGRCIATRVGDLTDAAFTADVFREARPDVVVHYAEQPSAPYSMLDVDRCAFTQVNNVVGTLNVLFALRDHAPEAHLVKLGTMGEYGTPNIDIEEGFIDIEHRGRRDRLPYPKQPGSFYHLSKVHDSHNCMFAARIWGLRITDLNQGIVYGVATEETCRDDVLSTRFDYDECFGTILNRFCVQAVAGHDLSVYGEGGQTRGYLNVVDTLNCVMLSALNPPAPGEYRVFNQFTERFSVQELAERVRRVAGQVGFPVEIRHIEDPRIERQQHYYNARHTALLELGLRPTLLTDDVLASIIRSLAPHRDRISLDRVLPHIRWDPRTAASASPD
jgi:UDP-sulfoquinovose synthase